MPRTALADVASAAAARLGEYRGAVTATAFGDADAEYDALRSGCGVFDLGWRAKLRVTGPDRVRWLNGMVTNNVRDLAPDHGVYCFLLSAQGRNLGDMYVYNRGEQFVLDTDRAQASKLLETFQTFIIMDDAEIADTGTALTAIGIEGAKAPTILAKAGVAAGSLQPLEIKDGNVSGVAATLVRTDARRPSFEFWLAPEHAPAVWSALRSAGGTPAGSEAFDLVRLADGVPQYGADIQERDLPQETEQMRALNFQKGCYVGQEIVERIRSRGAVHRTFTGFALEGPIPAPGTKVFLDGKSVGVITRAAALPGGRRVALGYILRQHATPETKVEIEGSAAQVAALPLE